MFDVGCLVSSDIQMARTDVRGYEVHGKDCIVPHGSRRVNTCRVATQFMIARAFQLLLLATVVLQGECLAGNYSNFNVAVYIPVGVVQRFSNPGTLSNEWDVIHRQVKVDKVYIEVQRDRQLADDTLLERVKRFFLDRGVRVAGGMALSDGGSGQFRSFCYTNPDDRKFIRNAVELAARHFDELIQDDFFFVTTKYDSDIAAKGDRSWTRFRLDLMDDAAKNLIIGPARAVNPRIKNVIKFPNWYEHFQGLGYDLEEEPRLFDGIYTGTETRDPVITDQHLQQYESYLIFRYFENIKPGANFGGWVDTFSIRYLDRYAEQLWDTMFAKAPEITMFNWAFLTRPVHPGDRATWASAHTSFDYDKMSRWRPGGCFRGAGRFDDGSRRRLFVGAGGRVPRQTWQPHRN